MFSLESPHRGDSNEYTQYTIFNIKKNCPKLSQICSYGFLFQGTQERVRNSHGKQAISVRATEVLLYHKILNFGTYLSEQKVQAQISLLLKVTVLIICLLYTFSLKEIPFLKAITWETFDFSYCMFSNFIISNVISLVYRFRKCQFNRAFCIRLLENMQCKGCIINRYIVN